MAISKEVYKEFEDIVGPEFISNDPTVMLTYHDVQHAAVVLPENTAQVQAIVKLCNRLKLAYTATSTAWTGNFPDGLIYMDLRRMNRIVEINEKNMYAVVEPYVISSQLQAELFKRGLVTNVKGSGSQGSAMLKGHGHLDQSTGGDDRNHLAVEWVTPDGELVRTGSLGSTNEWCCGDGPGPSLRSIINSAVPPGTTPGVFTKCAVKLYHWNGPPKWELEGVLPKYTLSELPKNMMARYYSFPSIDEMWQAEIALGEDEICFELMGFNPSMVASNITTCNEDDAEMFKKLDAEVIGPGFFVIIAGYSEADFEYRKKVLETIVAENNGQSSKSLEDPEMEGILLAHNTRISASVRETMRPGGMFKSIPVMGQRDLNIKWAIDAGKAKLPLIEAGHIVDDGGGFFGWGVEQGHLGKTEIFCKFNPRIEEDLDAVMKWKYDETRRAFDDRYFAVIIGNTDEDLGEGLCNFDIWWDKISKALDPNGVAPEGGPMT